MTRYRVTFEVESEETWDPHASRVFGTVLTLGSAPLAVYTLVVPVDAEIEELPDPEPAFKPGYFRCTDSIGWAVEGHIQWWPVKPPEGYWEPVVVIPKELAKAEVEEPVKPVTESSASHGGFSVGDFVRVRGGEGQAVGIVEGFYPYPDDEIKPIRVNCKVFGQMNFYAYELDHITGTEYFQSYEY